MSIIAFQNQDQLVLWQTEIRGQISDGYWENAKPHNHYRDWCNAEAIVDEQNPGIDFYPVRQRYNLTAPELLDAVGERMAYRVAMARRFGHEKIAKMRWDAPDTEKEWHDLRTSRENQAKWRAAGLEPLGHDGIGMKELRAILTAMKKVMQTRRAEQKQTSPDNDSAPPK